MKSTISIIIVFNFICNNVMTRETIRELLAKEIDSINTIQKKAEEEKWSSDIYDLREYVLKNLVLEKVYNCMANDYQSKDEIILFEECFFKNWSISEMTDFKNNNIKNNGVQTQLSITFKKVLKEVYALASSKDDKNN